MAKIVQKLDSMSNIQTQRFRAAEVTDSKTINYESKGNIEKEVRRIRTPIRQHKNLEKIN